jgi:hypothetical protein
VGKIELAGPSRQMLVELAPDFTDVIRVYAPEPRVWRIPQFVFVAAHHGNPPWGEVDPVGGQVPVPKAGVIAGCGQVVWVHADSGSGRAPDLLPG